MKILKKSIDPGSVSCFMQKLIKIMKLSIVLVMIATLNVLAEDVYSQNKVFSLNYDMINVGTVLKEIEDQSEFYFLFNQELVDVNKEVSINMTNKKLDEILIYLFNGTDVDYAMFGKQIILSPRKYLTDLKSESQQLSIKGKVTDTEGNPLPGVNIVEKGTTNGAVTNLDGEYSISISSTDAILSFSFIGFLSEEIEVADQTTINLTMVEDIQTLEEVVVVGYGSQKKTTLTGSVGTIKSEDLLKRPVANTSELLQGQVAGLMTRQSSGLPGADKTILSIRGYGENPLILVDGMETDIDQLDPNDIESISILKDASAAIYGARAGNGVILITTKRGEAKTSTITYHGSVSMTQPTFFPDVVNARQWAELMHESGEDPDAYSPTNVHYDPASNTLTNTIDGSIYEGYDWPEALYRNWTPQQQHNISANGGTDNIKYFVSVGFTDQESNFKSGDFDFNRYNIRSNIDAKINKNFNISCDFAFRETVLDKANFDLDAMYRELEIASPVWPIFYEEDPTRVTSPGSGSNPYFQTFKDYSGYIKNNEKNLQGSIELRYSLPMIKGLIAKARLNYLEIGTWDKTVKKTNISWRYDPIAASNGEDPWILGSLAGTNQLKAYTDKSRELLPLFTLEYERAWQNHHFKGILASETQINEWTSLEGQRKDYLSPYLIYASEEGQDNAENLKKDGNVGITETARSSIICRLSYDYLEKYILDFAMRADASAEYPSKGRWGYFPSISAAWRISEEPFIKNSFNNIDNLKLRASYGQLGYDAFSSFDYLTGYNITGESYIYGSTPAPTITSAGLSNPNITWETMTMYDVGLEGLLWNGLLGFEVDAFYRLRENILAHPTEQIPSTFGGQLPKTNLDKRDNRGFEIKLTHRNKIGEVSYFASPIFSWNRGKYVKVDEDVLPVTDDMDESVREYNQLWNNRYVKEGQWDDLMWGFVSDGFFMNQDEIDNYLINQDQVGNTTIKPGDIKYKDINGDNYIDWRDQAVIGKSGLPKIMYSFNTGLSYKGFQLSMLFQGGSNYNVTINRAAAAPFNNGSVPLELHYKYRAIIGTDSNGNAYITNSDHFKLPPVDQTGGTANNRKTSDFWTYKARFLRLKNLNFSYTLPKNLTSQIGINQCMLYLSATNLWAVSNLGIWKTSFDPEITEQTNRSYPPVKTVTFGLRLTL